MRLHGSLILAGLILSSSTLRAQKPPLSDAFQANSYTTSPQFDPAIASDGQGRFVVIWDSRGQDGQYGGIFGQRFDSLGSRVGTEFAVNTHTTGDQRQARVAMNSSGSFVVVWNSDQDGDNTGIVGQRFDATGARVGPEFPVNTYTTDDQSEPAVAIDDAGRFVVIWQSDRQDGSDNGIFAQRFSAAGAKAGPEFRVNTYTTNAQRRPSVAMDAVGNFVVVWDSAYQDGDGDGVFGRRFDSAGLPRGPEFAVNNFTSKDQNDASVASNRKGDFVVTWTSEDQYLLFPQMLGSGRDAFLQTFNSAGQRVGPEHAATSSLTGYQASSSIAMAPDGRFIVTWVSSPDAGTGFGILAQRFDRVGNGVGFEFSVQPFSTSLQDASRVVYDGTGFVAVWEGWLQSGDGDGSAILGRRQNLVPEALEVDAHGIGTSDLNGVLEKGEAVLIEPQWRNRSASGVFALDGIASNIYGAPGPTYTILDGTAAYGSVDSAAIAGCNNGQSQPCYALQLSGTRPATHWDAVLGEDLSIGGTQFWVLHVGDSFSDVPRSQPFYKKIETILHHAITSGCTPAEYCPTTVVTRAQMSIFIAKGLAGDALLIPSSGLIAGQRYACSNEGVSRFTDIAPTDSSCRHVHYLAAQNVTLGCSATQYCPSQTITRDAMASFIAKAGVAPGGGNAVPLTYGPDPGTGRSYSCNSGSPSLHFTDVPVSNAFCKHIHYLWARGVVDGCSATKYCPGQPVNRDAMAKFIANGFGLQLYTP
jgi:hypothetical protein